MTRETALPTDPAPLVACTISRDVQNFDLLIEDMETELGEAWGDLSFEDARHFFRQPESSDLKFIAIALDHADEVNLAMISELPMRVDPTVLVCFLAVQSIGLIPTLSCLSR